MMSEDKKSAIHALALRTAAKYRKLGFFVPEPTWYGSHWRVTVDRVIRNCGRVIGSKAAGEVKVFEGRVEAPANLNRSWGDLERYAVIIVKEVSR